MKHHSYTGGSALGNASPYLNFQTIMNNSNNPNYQKFIEN